MNDPCQRLYAAAGEILKRTGGVRPAERTGRPPWPEPGVPVACADPGAPGR